MNDSLLLELLQLRAEDLRVREELARSGELGKGHVPRMEAVHRANAARLREIIAEHGWPDHDLAGVDGAAAAWTIAQHAIGEPGFQRHALTLIEEKVAQGKVPAEHAAFLWDRIAFHEGRPQRFGTQGLPCADGHVRRWPSEDPEHLSERRAAIGMPPIEADPPESTPTPESLAAYREWIEGFELWLRKTGWR